MGKSYSTVLFILISLLGLSSCKSKEDIAVEKVVVFVKKSLRDPASLKVYSKTVNTVSEKVFDVALDYGAANGFGGMDRTTECFLVSSDFVMKSKCK